MTQGSRLPAAFARALRVGRRNASNVANASLGDERLYGKHGKHAHPSFAHSQSKQEQSGGEGMPKYVIEPQWCGLSFGNAEII